jgi:hypothetical protein
MITDEIKKPSLWQLQDRLLEFEEQLGSDETDLSELLGDIAKKVDGIKQMIDVFDSEAARFKSYKDEMAARQKSLEKASDRLRGYVIASLEKHGTNFEKGEKWVAKIRESKRCEIFTDKPTADNMFALGPLGINAQVIKTDYVWDKAKLKELLTDPEHNHELDNYGKIVVNKSINFSTVNAAKKG